MSDGGKKPERRQHNRVKNAGLGAKQLDLHRSFATFQLRLRFSICKMKININSDLMGLLWNLTVQSLGKICWHIDA